MPTQSLTLPGLDLPEAPPGLIPLNDRCCLQTSLGRRMVVVEGRLFANYALGDGATETMTMVNLVATGVATQVEVAKAFGCTPARSGATSASATRLAFRKRQRVRKLSTIKSIERPAQRRRTNFH